MNDHFSGRRILISLVIACILAFTLAIPLLAAPEAGDAGAIPDKESTYARAGWVAELSTKFHGVSGEAVIIDERTIELRNFNYDGGGPAVYAYLGAELSDPAFAAGIPIGSLLTRGAPYVDETVLLQLPDSGPTLDNFTAISIWCVDFAVDFGSGEFKPPTMFHFLPLLLNP